MSVLTDKYEDSLLRTQDAFELGYSDYSGTLSYLDDKRQDEVDYLVNHGLSYFPTSSDPTISNFFNDYPDTLQSAYQDFALGAVGVSAQRMAIALDVGHPTSSVTFGQLMGRVLGGDINGVFSALSDAATLAKSIAIVALGMQAVAATYEVMNSETHLDTAGKASFETSGIILGGEAGAAFVAWTGNPYIIAGGALIGSIMGKNFFADFYEEALRGRLDNGITITLSPPVVAEQAYQDAADYIAAKWDEDGQDAQDLWANVVSSAGDIAADFDELRGDYDWPRVAPLPDLVSGEIQPAFASAISAASPLVIDLSSGHSGVTLTTWSASSTATFFDLNDNGFAVQTAWVSGDTGLLARDLNSNGTIDSSAELFGSPTIDGFAKLAALDSNHDLRIDNNDADWSTLVVWTDTNGDAITQSGELVSLASLNIASIDLAGVAASTSTISGNPVSHVSTVRFTSGATAAIADVWFKHDNTNSYYADDYTLDVETLFLPTLRGYGTLPDLTIAMSQDEDLKDLVADLASSFTLDSFSDATTLESDIEAILFRWAGVDAVDPDSRGFNIDAQKLEFLEKLVGANYIQAYTGSADPQPAAAAFLAEAYQAAYKMLSAHLLLQIGAGQLFDTPLTYNPTTGEPSGDLALSSTAIDDLANIAPSSGPSSQEFWVGIAAFIDELKGIGNLTVTEAGWLDDAVTTSNALLDWSAVLNAYYAEAGTNSANGTSGADMLYGGATDDTIHGLGGADTIYGSLGDDTLYGDDADDIVYGDDGDDTLRGGSGNDTLYGDVGNDHLYGEGGDNILHGGEGGNFLGGYTGNDTFHYGGGDDVIDDPNGTDQVILPSGITLGDLTFSRVSSDNSTAYFDDLLIRVDGGGSIQIHNHFYNSASAVETLVFADTSTLNLATLTPDVILTHGNDNFYLSTSATYTVYGLDGNDTISTGGSGAHIIDGGNGNDTITAGTSSNETYIASAGFDTIYENGGTDTIVIPAEYALSDVTFYRIGSYDLGIAIAGLGQIQISYQLSSYGGVEYLHFLTDSSTVDLTDISVTSVGTSGNDTISAPSYNTNQDDTLDGREGNDTLYGAAGDDTYVFSADHDTINEVGYGGNDTIRVRESYDPVDVTMFFDANQDLQLVDSGSNNITVYRQGYASGYAIEHVTFGDSTDWDLTSMEIETRGTSGNDYLYGSDYGDASTADTFYGYAGSDSIYGGAGNDTIYGGDGADNLQGQVGNDTIYGGDGADTVYASGSSGNDIVHGDDGADTIYGAGTSMLYGDDGNDIFYNSASSGDAGSTTVTMDGGDGADTLYSGYGRTIMDGGNGADTLQGGGGAETFVFSSGTAFTGVDTVQYFNQGSGDKLDISDILDGLYTPGVDVITDFVQIVTNGSNSELRVDVTGSATFGSGQHIATIQGVTGLTDEAALVTAGTLLAA